MKKSEELFRMAVDAFVEELRERTGRPRFDYRCNSQDRRAWGAWLEAVGGEVKVGPDLIRDYILWGFQSWFNPSSPRDYSRSVRFSWVFGKRAVERWRALGSVETNKRVIRRGLSMAREGREKRKRRAGIDTEERRRMWMTLRPVEERFKAQWHNTARGLDWCIANTSLYFDRSPWCVSCRFKEECKEVERREMRWVWKIRGYGNEK